MTGRFRLVLAGAGVLALCGLALCGIARAAPPGVLGYLDPTTGAFRPVVVPPAPATAPPVAHGVFDVAFTITVASTDITAATPITCSVTATLITGGVATETATVFATRTGNTAKCQVKIPYRWVLFLSSSGQASINYEIKAAPTGAPPQPAPVRISDSFIDEPAIPTAHATTSYSVLATI